MNKIKFYWNEEYPDVLYCIGAGNQVYILSTAEHTSRDPETGMLLGDKSNSNLMWLSTQWEADFVASSSLHFKHCRAH
jgi:hypothetical protein